MATCAVGPAVESIPAERVACKSTPETGAVGGNLFLLACVIRNTTEQHRHNPPRSAPHSQRDWDFFFGGWLPVSTTAAGVTGGVDPVSGAEGGAAGIVIGAEGWEVAGGTVTASGVLPGAPSGIEIATVEALVTQA